MMRIINYDEKTQMLGEFPQITKLGAINYSGEMTPFVHKGRLMRMELIDPYRGTRKSMVSAHIRDVETGREISTVGAGGYYFSAYTEGDTVYVLGVDWNKQDTIWIHKSTDLVHWESRILFERPGWEYYNTSLTKGPDGYVLLLECTKPKELVGDNSFTLFFAISKDLVSWEFLDEKCFGKNWYNGGPWMKYVNGWYYLVDLQVLPFNRFTNYVFRTKDLEEWYVGLYNPFLIPDNDDKKISPNCTMEDLETFGEEVNVVMNINNSDVDMCDWNGKTYINYFVGNQLGSGYLADAIYDGTMEQLLESFF